MARVSKVFLSLDRKPTAAGVAVEVAMLEGLVFSLLLLLQAWYLLPLLFPMHWLFRYLHRKDDIWFKAYVRYSDEGDIYDPFPRAIACDKRPVGFGKGLLC